MTTQTYHPHRTVYADTRGKAFARRVRHLLSGLPGNLEDQLARHPYGVLGIAFTLGVAAGIVFGSRILRTALASAASAAIVEFGRNYLRDELGQQPEHHPGRAAEVNCS